VFVGSSSGSACKPVVLQPHAGVRIPSVLHDVRRRSEALGERCPRIALEKTFGPVGSGLGLRS
jgi:hypothetical protein